MFEGNTSDSATLGHNTRSPQYFTTFICHLAALLFLLTMPTVTADAAQDRLIRLDPMHGEYDVAARLEFLTETNREYSLAEIASPPLAREFKPLQKSYLHLAANRPTWLRLSLFCPSTLEPRDCLWWLQVDNSNINQVDLYRPAWDESGGYQEVHSGVEYPFSTREVAHRSFVFKLPLTPGTVKTIYLRLMSRNHITTPIRLWRPEAFNRHSQQDFMTYGALYGILLGMCLFNLFVFLSLRDQVYLRYVFYMFSMLMYLLNHNGHYIVLFDMGPGGSRIWHWAFLGGLIFFASTFTKSFLSTPTALPRLNKLISLSQVLGVVVVVSGLANLEVVAHPVSLAAGLLGPGCGLAAGVIRASRGFKPARYFLLAWSVLLIGVMQYVLHSLGVSPLDVSGSLIMSLGAAAESLLLSFALADRIRLLRKEKEALALSRMRYRAASLTDGLTGLFNLRYLQDHLVRETDQAKVDDSPLCLIMMDVDDFKRFNDAHGHQMGDRVLIRLADVLRSCARTKDSACRYGGEEFVLVLPDTLLDQACLVAERIRGEFAGQTFLVDNGDKLAATISLGVAQLLEKESPANLLKRADHALYQAKTLGKNRVEKDR